MSEIKDGGPAFPRVGEGFGNPNYDAPGMSLRDWFAGQALAGFCANPEARCFGGYDESREHVAKLAYDQADAMLKERAK